MASNSLRSMLMGSSGAGSGSNGIEKYAAIRRSARYPALMLSCACALDGMFRVEHRRAAVSSTTPADVTHDRVWLIDRKNTNEGCDVWVSSTSANHVSQSSQSS